MSLHRITAGSGYDYLTRQVAALDSTEKGHTGLASYYSEKGEVPGRWLGSGLAGIDGLSVGDVVTAEQMQALFGSGHHPLAAQRKALLTGPEVSEQDVRDAVRLGSPFPVFAHDVSPFRVEVARRVKALVRSQGLPKSATVAIEDRARIRTVVAREMFTAEYGRAPLDERELAGHLAKLSRQQTTAVAGFDLTFSPVKSVSSLWAVADPVAAAVIEQAHHRAVRDALTFLERQALFTRTGRGGIRQVEVRGLVAAAFTHRDSRAGDPDLHTHVAVANKVQTVTDGRWLSIDGRLLFKATVAASETYNTALERHLGEALGVVFEARPASDPRKRPVRELAGVDPALTDRWSSRRVAIEARRTDLAAAFRRDHGRPPTPVEAIALAQQATLETRDAKHEPRSLAEQRAKWRAQARQVLGGDQAITAMIHRVLRPTRPAAARLDSRWLDETARQVIDRVQQDRSTWQTWHVRAEALRIARAAQVPAGHVEAVVDLVVDRALASCRPLRQQAVGEPVEPEPLRRSDGTSVYTVAGSQLYTSTAILNAEARLVDAAGRHDGRVVPAAAVDAALLETAADQVTLNPGQVLLVREMATSGARLQLAIAPAGSGKTTAMTALSRAWTTAGGTVLGLAPSAAAAAALGEQLDGHTDTMAKLVWSLHHQQIPDWMGRIGPDTLVVIDEAGMADTLSLDTVVGHVLERGGSVRLIGDDQQLAAIGAGGVLRDIHTSHGALRLSELVRFTDRAEGSASLALRDGHTAALGFYLDQRRLHVGDQTTMAEDLFAAWTADRAAGRDSIMLAPTRDLVADLNQRARTQRLAGHQPGREISLADGTTGSVGDVIITRLNNRHLRTTATDWVKNGDRWTITAIGPDQSVQARHTRTGRHIRLPADYVAEAVELGYACTTHTAQGVTADTMHGLLSGDESRQHAYTMLTRGRHANHAYLVVVGDGDPHTLIRPDTINPPSPTDLLERILARDESPLSATTSLRESTDPQLRLGQAAARYHDALTFAAHHLSGDVGVRALERAVDHALPQLTDAPAWPALRAQLLLVQADGHDPIDVLTRACAQPLSTAHDPCTVLARRIADHHQQPGRRPLPWLPHIPAELAAHSLWSDYLTARHHLVYDLADEVRHATLDATSPPAWVAGLTSRPPVDLIADIQVWRAATGVPAADQRPTGEPRHELGEARWQTHLNRRLTGSQSAALDEWWPTLHRLSPHIANDPFAPIVAARLAQLASSGINTSRLLADAARQGPLPDDHAAAALWWRLSRHLTAAVAETVDTDHHLATAWLDEFTRAIGPADLQTSPWWPALVTTIERGLQRGWQLHHLIDEGHQLTADGHTDLCQAWVWRLSLLTDRTDLLDEERDDPTNQPPTDLYDGWTPTSHPVDIDTGGLVDAAGLVEPAHDEDPWDPDWWDVDQTLAIEGLIRNTMGAPEPTDADIRLQLARADAWRDCPIPRERLVHVNQLTANFYQTCLPGSWAQPYLTSRFHVDLTGHPHIRPGYAPDSWTALVTHLRRHGITDQEMLAAGVATTASTGRLIDRFRDRALFPITHDGDILGFVARRNPTHDDHDNRGPKYLNTAETPLFHKGDQLFIAGHLDPDTIPVIVEGPMDAIAITLTGEGRHIGVAPLGTSLTNQQAAQLQHHGQNPIVATDADLAGHVAAERDYWILTPYNLNPRHARLPDGTDPADLLTTDQKDALRRAIDTARPLADTLIDERLANLEGALAILEAAHVLAAQPPHHWSAGAEHIAEQTRIPAVLVRAALADLVRAWNANPRKAAQQAAGQTMRVKGRFSEVASLRAAKQRHETAALQPVRSDARVHTAGQDQPWRGQQR